MSERKGVEPFYHDKAQAIYYAQQRGRLGNALVRIYDERGQVERKIEPPEGNVWLLPESAIGTLTPSKNDQSEPPWGKRSLGLGRAR